MTQIAIYYCILFKEKHEPKQNILAPGTLRTNAGLWGTLNMGLEEIYTLTSLNLISLS